jgi:hypothetical protein
MDHTPATVWLTKYQRAGLWLLLFTVLIFGVVVENRSVFLKRHMTDADVYFRTAWAVRTGADLYEVKDTNGWHYQYPPFLAVIMMPLADPPPGADRTGMLPYPVSIALWYLISVACLAIGIHWFASALEPALHRSLGTLAVRGSADWWSLRVIPLLVCLPSVGRALSRGQINLLVLMLFFAMAALVAARRRTLAGASLGVAIGIKLIPGFLLLYGIWRRDWRFLAGSIGGLLFTIVLVPAVVMGPARTLQSTEKFCQVLLGPALVGGGDEIRNKELLDVNGTDSQAFKAIINNTRYASVNREKRPAVVPPWVQIAHLALVALFTGITLWFGRAARPGDVIYNFIFIGCLMVIMIPTSPVSHTHYFVYVLPLVIALMAHAWDLHHRPRLGAFYIALFLSNIFLNVICMPMSASLLKDLGVSLYAALILWGVGIHAMHQRSKMPEEPEAVAAIK